MSFRDLLETTIRKAWAKLRFESAQIDTNVISSGGFFETPTVGGGYRYNGTFAASGALGATSVTLNSKAGSVTFNDVPAIPAAGGSVTLTILNTQAGLNGLVTWHTIDYGTNAVILARIPVWISGTSVSITLVNTGPAPTPVNDWHVSFISFT